MNTESKLAEFTWDGRPHGEVFSYPLEEETGYSYAERLQFEKEATAMGVWEYDISNGTLLFDDQMLAFYGYTREDFTKSFSALSNRIHPQDRLPVEAVVHQAMKDKTEFQQDYQVILPDGSTRFLNRQGIVICDVYENPICLVGMNKDITQRKPLETVVEESTAALFRAIFHEEGAGNAAATDHRQRDSQEE